MNPNKVKFSFKELLIFLLLFLPLGLAFLINIDSILGERISKVYFISVFFLPLIIAGTYIRRKAFGVYEKSKKQNKDLVDYVKERSGIAMVMLVLLFLAYVVFALFNISLP